MKHREERASQEDAPHVSEPDGAGNSFIIVPTPDGRVDPPPADKAGSFAREGA
jgi:hypothetical protein